MLEKVLHHKLLKEGEQGQGVVTKRRDQGTESGPRGYGILYEVQGHIKFPDGTESGFRSELLNSLKVGSLDEGRVVPVRYDPADHSKVVLDVVALEQGHSAAEAASVNQAERARQERIAQADARLARASGSAHHAPAAEAPPDPLDTLRKLADLHKQGVLTDEEFQAQKRKLLGE
jgi:Short C-terminal domain